MTTGPLENIAWRFGGALASFPSAVAWSILAACTAAGIIWVTISYRRTLVELSPWKRRSLLAIRILLVLTVAALLAGPVKVEPAKSARDETRLSRPLALLIDQSESMRTPDNRRQRRIDDARRRWQSFVPSAEKNFSGIKPFAFADDLSPIDDANSDASIGAGNTRLFSSLQRVLASAPPGGWGGVVTLTDGLDTSGASLAELSDVTIAAATNSNTPLYFVPGRNRYAGGSFLQLRDWTVPSRLSPRSTFRLEVTIDSFQYNTLKVPVNLRVGETWRPVETLTLETGHRMMLWSTDITAAEAGTLPIELRIGTAPHAVTARAEIQVQAADATRILYYQGALDWGYKFFADILRRDPSFTLTPIFRLAPARVSAATRTTTVGPPLPTTSAGFADYDIVVLANATAAQLSVEQQSALTTWVRSGGVLVFLAPDDSSTQGFAGSEIEKMLPVVFASDAAVDGELPQNPEQRRAMLREHLRRVGGSGRMQSTFPEEALSEFSWEPAAKKIFGSGEITSPRFMNYAHVLRAKPGAEVLARHPTALSPKDGDSGRAILLAVQRYGQGQSAVLTSDALWRWKLNQPSSERNVEKFWQNLFAWLGRGRNSDLRFDRAPLTVRRGQDVQLRLLGNGTHTASLVATSTTGTFALDQSTRESDTARLFRWSPPNEGEWQFTATDAAGHATRHWLQVMSEAKQGENSGAPPDEALLIKLAERTGGAVLSETDASDWKMPRLENELPAPPEVFRPLWHQLWIFAGLLGGYSLELILRRRWRLL